MLARRSPRVRFPRAKRGDWDCGGVAQGGRDPFGGWYEMAYLFSGSLKIGSRETEIFHHEGHEEHEDSESELFMVKILSIRFSIPSSPSPAAAKVRFRRQGRGIDARARDAKIAKG